VGETAGHLVLAGDEVPGLELGVERERLPALRAEPGRAAGSAVLAAPTGLPQLEQNRLSSGTTGSVMIALLASMAGAGGIVVRPAPSRAVRSRCDSERTRRVLVLPPTPARAEPRAVEASRLLARDIVDGELDTPAGPAGSIGTESPEAPQVSQ
jgi:hypothetical protein